MSRVELKIDTRLLVSPFVGHSKEGGHRLRPHCCASSHYRHPGSAPGQNKTRVEKNIRFSAVVEEDTLRVRYIRNPEATHCPCLAFNTPAREETHLVGKKLGVCLHVTFIPST